jgi:hypothetical protein
MSPVESDRLSTVAVPAKRGSTMPLNAVFPGVHTPYDSYKDLIQ